MMAIHYVPLSPRGFSKSNIALMRAFYLQWEIFQTPSGKFVAQAKGSPFSQLPGRSEDESPDTQLVPVSEISYLAGAFRLPWSHYVQLLAVDNPNARGFYEAEVLREGGPSVSSAARSAPNFTSGRRCRRTRLAC